MVCWVRKRRGGWVRLVALRQKELEMGAGGCETQVLQQGSATSSLYASRNKCPGVGMRDPLPPLCGSSKKRSTLEVVEPFLFT